MTRSPATLRPAETIVAARARMAALGVRHLPVVDPDEGLIGMVSARDIAPFATTRWTPASQRPIHDAHTIVAMVMSDDVRVAKSDTHVSEIARWMVQHHIGAVPVIDDSDPPSVIGIVSYVDILRSLTW